MSEQQMREAFEKGAQDRDWYSLLWDAERGEHGAYRDAMAQRDYARFCEGWQAALRASGERTGKDSLQVGGERGEAEAYKYFGADCEWHVAFDLPDSWRQAIPLYTSPPSISEAALRKALRKVQNGSIEYATHFPHEIVDALRKLGVSVQP